MGARPSGTVTFLFTDIEGSTRLWDEHPESMREALARHDSILRSAIDGHDGAVFSTGGDGVAAAFQRAGDAVAAAVSAQRSLQRESWPEATPLKVRMGLHTGEAQERDGDYFGPPVNRAARVMAAAHGRQIVMSAVTAGVLGPVNGVTLVDLGEHRLKGIVDPLRIHAVRAEGLTWVDRPLSSTSEVRGNLPRPATEWFGAVTGLSRRAAELPKRRLVTLTGTGGVGKTRTALEVGWLVADEFPDGVWFLDLASVVDPDAVITSIGSTMGVPPQPGMSMVGSIVDWLGGRRLLMIVDNCEHVMAPVAELASAIVTGLEAVTMLATSREPLGVQGERVVPVPSLATADATELFCDRARAADESVTFTDVDLAAIRTICERLDGIPLAIELAAARIRSAAPADLLARLDDRFRLLRGSGRGGLERHQTLRATVAWSYQLLAPAEQTLFDRLSAFAGTFDAAAAEAVTAGGVVDELDVIDLLDSLVDKSMVVAERAAGGTRYRLLETMRQYGEERLLDRGETTSVRDRHLAHYRDLAERSYPEWCSPRQLQVDARFDREWDNLRAAHHWAITTDDLGSATRILHPLDGHSQVRLRHEYGDWLARTIELGATHGSADPVLLGRAARWAMYAADYPRTLDLASRGIAAAPSIDHPDAVLALAMTITASRAAGSDEHSGLVDHLLVAAAGNPDPFMHNWSYGPLLEAVRTDPDRLPVVVAAIERSVERCPAPFLLILEAWARGFVAGIQQPPDLDAATHHHGRALQLATEADDRQWQGLLLNSFVFVSILGDRPDLGTRCRQAIEYLYDTRNWWILWPTVETAALWLTGTGDRRAACVVYGHLEAGHRAAWADTTSVENRVLVLAEVHDEPDREALMASGAAMTRDEIVRFVLDRLPTQ